MKKSEFQLSTTTYRATGDVLKRMSWDPAAHHVVSRSGLTDPWSIRFLQGKDIRNTGGELLPSAGVPTLTFRNHLQKEDKKVAANIPVPEWSLLVVLTLPHLFRLNGLASTLTSIRSPFNEPWVRAQFTFSQVRHIYISFYPQIHSLRRKNK